MKASKQCPKCDSLRVGYLEKVIDRGKDASEKDAVVGRTELEGWFGGCDFVGELEAYVCADCGYFEQYVKSPEDVPYDKLQGFHWLNPEAAEAGPYR